MSNKKTYNITEHMNSNAESDKMVETENNVNTETDNITASKTTTETYQPTFGDRVRAIKPYLVGYINTPGAVKTTLIIFGALFIMFTIMMILLIVLAKQ
jgi:hypothetical protein